MTDQEAYFLLNLLTVNLNSNRMQSLQNACGSVHGIFEYSKDDLMSVPGISENLAGKIANWEKYADPEKEQNLVNRSGVVLLTPADDDYPNNLREISFPPLCLYVRGTIPWNINNRSLAFVGTRNISVYGAKMARHLAESAAYAHWATVSGLAVGVDTVIHRATVDAGGETVAVLGGGLMRFHPQENLQLARDITGRGGAIITEYPMSFSPTRYSFPQRNRIISGLSLGTVVVEAGSGSGSLITAACALEQNRHVFAVPRQADQPNASGCNSLIRQGAVLVEKFEHIMEVFEFLPGLDADNSSGTITGFFEKFAAEEHINNQEKETEQ